MRLGQLARQLDIKTDKILNYLKEQGVEMNAHPNAKVPDEYLDELNTAFGGDDQQEEETVQVEEARVSAVKPEKAKTEETTEPEIPAEPEHIETQKTELSEPKIIGKIDLPNKKDIQVEIDGVVYDQEFLDKKKKDELAAQREERKKEIEEQKKLEAQKRKEAQEKRKLEQERQAMLAREKNNALSLEEEKKRQIILKAQQERERKLEENRKKRQADYYKKEIAQKLAAKQKAQQKKKRELEDDSPQEGIEQNTPKETNPIKRFIKWLNT